MKDSEFTALLNLYLDHEISAADAARLEAEVQSNPERRKVYRQYCQMQKACKLLAEDFQTETAAETSDRKVIDFNAEVVARPARTSNWYVVGALTAAAACVAIVFVGRNRQAGPATPGELTQPIAAVTAPTPSAANVTSVAPASAQLAKSADVVAVSETRPAARTAADHRTGLIAEPLSLTAEAQRAATLAQANAQFDWMRTLQLAPVDTSAQAADLRFEARPATLQTNPRTYRSAQPLDATVEMTAFRFSK